MTSALCTWPPFKQDLGQYDPSGLDWHALERRLQDLGRRYIQTPWRCFGNEARAALFLRAGLHNWIDPAFADPPSYRHPGLDRFFTRPGIEPIVYASWRRFDCWDMDDAWALEVTSALTGKKAAHRSRSIEKPPLGDLPALTYAPLQCAGHWLEATLAIRDRSDLSPLEAASLAHGIVALYHPMNDGNGRLARVMFHGVLRNRAGIDAPFLPLGPVYYKVSHYLMSLTRQLSVSGDWAAYLRGAYDVAMITIEKQELFQDDQALLAILSGMSS